MEHILPAAVCNQWCLWRYKNSIQTHKLNSKFQQMIEQKHLSPQIWLKGNTLQHNKNQRTRGICGNVIKYHTHYHIFSNKTIKTKSINIESKNKIIGRDNS